MRATTIVDTLRAQGWEFAIDGQGLRIRRPRGALTDELRQALLAEQQRAPVPPQAGDIVAVKVWSETLQEAIWVVADGVPIADYLREGKVFTHHEVRALKAQDRGVKAWAPLDAEMEG
jgi:hypothetical protein